MVTKVKKNDVVVLIDSAYRKFFVDTNGKTDKIKGVGVIDPTILVGKTYGTELHDGKRFITNPNKVTCKHCKNKMNK